MEKIVEALQTHIQNMDWKKLSEYWAWLETRLWSKLPAPLHDSVLCVQAALYKWLLVTAYQSNASRPDRPDRSDRPESRILDFLDKLHAQLDSLPGILSFSLLLKVHIIF